MADRLATATAARRLHIPNMTHVVNRDLPTDIDDKIHGISRTDRAEIRGRRF